MYSFSYISLSLVTQFLLLQSSSKSILQLINHNQKKRKDSLETRAELAVSSKILKTQSTKSAVKEEQFKVKR